MLFKSWLQKSAVFQHLECREWIILTLYWTLGGAGMALAGHRGAGGHWRGQVQGLKERVRGISFWTKNKRNKIFNNEILDNIQKWLYLLWRGFSGYLGVQVTVYNGLQLAKDCVWGCVTMVHVFKSLHLRGEAVRMLLNLLASTLMLGCYWTR